MKHTTTLEDRFKEVEYPTMPPPKKKSYISERTITLSHSFKIWNITYLLSILRGKSFDKSVHSLYLNDLIICHLYFTIGKENLI